MIVVGLTGGIGSGKSSVSDLLSRRGAVVIDADQISHEVMAPGGTAYDGVVQRFGREILAADRTIDRQALARVVFSDPEALNELTKLTHPAIGAVISKRLAAESSTDHVVVLDVPLLVESARQRPELMGVMVIDTPRHLALARLVERRGMDRVDAEARMANQASREERLARADFVIDNSGDLEALEAEVDRAMDWICTLAPSEPN